MISTVGAIVCLHVGIDACKVILVAGGDKVELVDGCTGVEDLLDRHIN